MLFYANFALLSEKWTTYQFPQKWRKSTSEILFFQEKTILPFLNFESGYGPGFSNI